VLLERKRSVLSVDRDRLSRAPRLVLERERGRTDALAGRLAALSPTATVRRGYAIVRSGGAVVRDGRQLGIGGRVDVELASGGFGARVEDVRK
jgi:exodeoxyribonuclease VII large subunit